MTTGKMNKGIVAVSYFMISLPKNFSDLVFDCICYINDIVNADVSYYIFSTYKKSRDYYSPNLDIVAEPKSS